MYKGSHKSERSGSDVLQSVDSEFHDIVSDADLFRRTTEKFLDNIIDTLIIGVVHEVHRNVKCGFVNLDEYLKPEPSSQHDKLPPLVDIFSHLNYRIKRQDCLCRNCDRLVLGSGFASHLHGCLGLPTSHSRSARRRATKNSKDLESLSYNELVGDDEDDKRKKRKGRNGSKKLKSTPKKNSWVDADEPIDVEGEAYDPYGLQDLLQESSSRASSPADSSSGSSSGSNASAGGSTKRRSDKLSKSKKRKERSSLGNNGSPGN